MATTNGPIGVAVIGCGSISHPHLDGWQRLVRAGEARLEVACDNELERAEAQAGRYGAAAAATDFAEVVQRPEVQAVDICLPHHLHLPAILAAAEAGVHVLCEKPLVLNMDEAVTAIRACRDAGVKLMTADRDRFEPPARAVKRILDAGLIGDIYHVLERHMLHKDVITQGSRSNMGWKLGKATAGGGARPPRRLLLHRHAPLLGGQRRQAYRGRGIRQLPLGNGGDRDYVPRALSLQ